MSRNEDNPHPYGPQDLGWWGSVHDQYDREHEDEEDERMTPDDRRQLAGLIGFSVGAWWVFIAAIWKLIEVTI